METSSIHTPVLLQEVIEYLNLSSEKRFIDATLDGGGHTKEILRQYPDISVLGIEFDQEELADAKERDKELFSKIIAVNESYTELGNITKKYDFSPDAVLFDLGISSWHIESSNRGFSFQKKEALDMRFNTSKQTKTAADVVNIYSEKELERILALYGEEQFSKSIARRIVKERTSSPITETEKLVSVIRKAVPLWYQHRKMHCATKTFQAIRMEVNGELDAIRSGLKAAIDVLNPSGRLVVISFHGLEDKAVRSVFKEEEKGGVIKWVTKKTIRPKWEEIKKNPRARSAKMKIAEKLS